MVAHQPVDAASFVLELAHRLLERAALLADEVGGRHAHVGEEDLAEVAVGRHVLDRSDFDARGVHRHDHFADAGVRRALGAGATDEVAEVGDGREARPDLLAVDHERVAVAFGRRLQAGEVAARVGFAHADAPRRLAGDDARQERGLLVGRSVGEERWAHLAIREPRRGNGRTGLDHLLADDQTVDRRAGGAAVLVVRPRHADPAVRRQLLGELLRVPIDPRIVEAAEPCDCISRHVGCVGPQRGLRVCPGEVHRC